MTNVVAMRGRAVTARDWHKALLGPQLGYLPQGVALFDGTLADNIARFGELDMGEVAPRGGTRAR